MTPGGRGKQSGFRRRRSSDPWSDQRSIRAELFSDERLIEHGVSLADSQVTVSGTAPDVSLLDRLADDNKVLIRCYESLVGDLSAGRPITPAAEWLVDNFHQVEEAFRQVRMDLPPGYFRQLPKLGEGFLEGHPRIFGVMWGYVAHTDSLFDPDSLAAYIRAYESRKPLTLGELWAVAITLRLLLLENLRRIALQVVDAASARARADDLADQLLGTGGQQRLTLAQALPNANRVEITQSFAVQLFRRLAHTDLTEGVEWVTAGLAARNTDPDAAIEAEHARLARQALTIRNIFTSLRLVADVNWEDRLESVSVLEQELRTNPGYPALDFTTRNTYRSAVETLARGSAHEELEVARAALAWAREATTDVGQDLGFWLIDDGRRDFAKALGYRRPAREWLIDTARAAGLSGYLGALTLTTALCLALALLGIVWAASGFRGLGALGTHHPALWIGLVLLLSLPISSLALGLINYHSAKLFAARPLPALSLDAGVPPEFRTLVVVPTMLTSPDGVDELIRQLEVHYLANLHGELYFAALTDWVDADTPLRDGDEELLDRALSGVRELNARYGNRFLLFHRERRWNSAEGVWMGWERKRGKLDELNRYLRGAGDTSHSVVEGRFPGQFRYVITLDADTLLPRDAARRLVAKLAHPLNRAHFDERTRHVIRGYSILQPRVTPSLPLTEDTSPFQEVYSTQRGLDPYAFAVSDVYQDLFGEGSFAGKGIYDIDAFMVALEDRIPENSLLSHDLLEGNFSRSGLVTDVEVVEEYPTAYEVAAARNHRWLRGDWQLLPWLLGARGKGLTGLGRWKMLDNLRRSIVPIFTVAGTLLAAAFLPWPALLAWMVVLLLIHLVPPTLPLWRRLLLNRKGITRASQARALAEDTRIALALTALNITLIAHEAQQSLDAILRTLGRLVSRRKLLEWTTAAALQKSAKGTLGRYYGLMGASLVAPVALLILALLRSPLNLAVAAPLALAWLIAPAVMWRVSRHYDRIEVQASAADRAYLRLVARRTWHFFATFVTAEENHLPPDNFQEVPEPKVAHRTSPTNIGLYLLTTVSARDFGWIGLADAVDRLQATCQSMANLEHHQGHLYNWYDTRTCAPLNPRYVSSVDSGNLIGHLIALAQTCQEWLADPGLDRPPLAGLGDGLKLVREALEKVPRERAELAYAELARAEAMLAGATGELDEATATTAQEATRSAALRTAPEVPELLADLAAPLKALAWATAELPGEAKVWAAATCDTLASLQRDTRVDREELTRLICHIEDLARREILMADFRLLLDPRRQLLSVGLRADTGKLDESCYDLLASECRLASYIAVSKGNIRTKHWFRLGRSVTAVGGGAALLSWSGSMFEYLMPPLVMRAPATGLLNRTAQLVVRRQMQYAEERGVPWGISESGFNARDPEMNYQYSPFGVPGLGIVRGLADNLVVAPYATGLASMVEPDKSVENYRRLTQLGARGTYGFYEAIDFTAERLPRDAEHVIVQNYMAHHQGMTVVAIHNVVLDGLMRDRFHAEPMIAASEMLLQERQPRDVPVTHARREELRATHAVRAVEAAEERTLSGSAALNPAVHLMSNGGLSLLLTPAGGSQLRWRGVAINRWHPDLTSDQTGAYCYLRDRHTGDVWSTAALPVVDDDPYAVQFAEDRAEFIRRHGDLTTSYVHHLSPEADVVARRLTITNRGEGLRRLRVSSYAELVLAAVRDDDAHPAFSKLFVHTEYLPELGVLLATRRRRSSSDPEIWVAHFAKPAPFAGQKLRVETDREAFLGRNGRLTAPEGLAESEGADAGGNTGYVLDPIMSLSQDVDVPANGRAVITFWTAVAATRDEVLRLVDQHLSPGAYDRVEALRWTHSQIMLRHLNVTSREAARFQELAGHVLYPLAQLRSSVEELADARSQSALWSLGISGDLPMLVVRIDDERDLGVAEEAVKAFEYWRTKRFPVDVVLLNERSSSYVQELHHALERIAAGIRPRTGAPDSNGRVFVVQRDQANPDAVAAMLASAAVVLVARRGNLAHNLPTLDPARVPRGELPAGSRTPVVARTDEDQLLHFNGHGGFSADGREYVVVLDPGESTPGPWTNVVANDEFGFHATAEGSGYTWWRNSRDNQLTPWPNDPVRTPVSEVCYVRDDETGQVACPTASPVHGAGRHVVRHGFGYSRFTHDMGGLELDQTVFVAGEDPVKMSLLTLTNTGEQVRRVTVTAYAEPVLGMNRAAMSRHIITEHDPQTGALLARNPWVTQYPGTMFLDLAGAQDSVTGDRQEFVGLHGSLAAPAAMFTSDPLSGRTGAGLDPCLAARRTLTLQPGQSADLVVTLGAAPDANGCRRLIEKARGLDPRAVLAGVVEHWEEQLGQVQVKTPDSTFDVMMNGWLLYQTLACRMLARSGFYQASGAYGFRDQLQDSMAAVLVQPELSREHVLRAAGRQFPEGDVQHWWLPASGQGVRTRITDDVVWLSHAVARYVRVTGDYGVLDEQVPFLAGDELTEDEHEKFFQPETSAETATLWEHCRRGLELCFAKTGRHGLPLIGGGDWNDGMNRVGIGGDGESVWLGWFLHTTLSEVIGLAEQRGDAGLVDRCREQQKRVLAALEDSGWDGGWYRRGYFDDGTPLGSASSTECRIDGIAQSWAVLSGACRPERGARALAEVENQLVMPEAGVVRLFTPPFDVSEPDPGYIRAYPPGVRENGGQYTHGAIWTIFAYAARGDADAAARMFGLINPVNHALNAERAAQYRVEPYVVCADVYSVEPHVGRGGWTWYTGSSGWLYRAGLEAILGIRREGDHLVLRPCFPEAWEGVSVSYRFGTADYQLTFGRCADRPDDEPPRVVLDGQPVIQCVVGTTSPRAGALVSGPGDLRVPLVDDGQSHTVVVTR
ncbi:GH36-type glycosyl hydrolase domain-containing protein [Granulicoccus sp. GXG6511]|uniref:GH36-type glycosyl hydrolase domain-containing protein n=1 Tax=Granulicoccus sp. GXG6511 TaxID=3381351 RepID=UPI003D7EA669